MVDHNELRALVLDRIRSALARVVDTPLTECTIEDINSRTVRAVKAALAEADVFTPQVQVDGKADSIRVRIGVIDHDAANHHLDPGGLDASSSQA